MLGALAALAKDNPEVATLLAQPAFDSAGNGGLKVLYFIFGINK